MDNIVRKDVRLKTSLKIPVKIRQPRIITTIIIPPKKSPDKIIPPGTFVNLISKVVKSPTDVIPNMSFNLRSSVIITGNVLTFGEGGIFTTNTDA
jgi:hypothetical protein